MGVLIALGLAAVTFWAIGSARNRADDVAQRPGETTAQAFARMQTLALRAQNGDESAWPEIGRVLGSVPDATLNRLYDEAALAKTRAVIDAERLYFDHLLEAIRQELNHRSDPRGGY